MLAKLIFKVYDSRASHKWVVKNVIARSITAFLYGTVWFIKRKVYDCHVGPTQDDYLTLRRVAGRIIKRTNNQKYPEIVFYWYFRHKDLKFWCFE